MPKKIETEGRMSFEKKFPKNEIAVFWFGVFSLSFLRMTEDWLTAKS
jgi:hypothetical protein